jgi:oxalate---CoA ligase
MANQDRPALLGDSLHAPLLQLWKKLLKTEDISIDDDLFEKGGDSLMAIDLWLELQRLTGRQLPDSILFETSTIRALAKRLSSSVDGREGPRQAHPKFAGSGPSGE